MTAHPFAPDRPSAAVIICAYTVKRWADLCEAVGSVRRQTVPAQRIIVVVDHNNHLLERARRAFPGAVVVPNRQERGLTGARNTGLAESAEEVVAFLDDDAAAAPDWLELLLAEHGSTSVAAVGGYIEPRWLSGRPAWFPEEFDWVVGCSYHGLPEQRAVVRNVIGANMSFRRAAAVAAGGFAGDLGRVGTRPSGCEETHLCIEVTRRTGGRVIYQPRARVAHRVPVQRARLRYFFTRCYGEGRSKAIVARLAGADAALRTERAYVVTVLGRALVRALPDAVRDRSTAPVARALVIVGGLATTAAGYLAGLPSNWRSRRAAACHGRNGR